jgi:tRNA-2-methylthio-N6-dimethylallyladenosine synthase
MNVYDSERIQDILITQGYTIVASPEEADLCILNTCHIREKASEKVFSEVGRLRLLKHHRAAQGKNTAIVVAGCVAQAEGREILKRAPVVDLVIGPQNYHLLPDHLKAIAQGERRVDIDFPMDDKFNHLASPDKKTIRKRGVNAFLTIQEGCDKFCSFCCVPYTRGAEYSRPVSSIVHEAKNLAQAGVREITLLGQNVNAYHGEGPDGSWSLGKLLYLLAEIPGIERLRYMTSHPNDMHSELIRAHSDLPQVMPFLHLPIQSGSNPILKAMNRRHTVDAYRRILEAIRHVCPHIALSSDFIVGFPGESDEDFQNTLDLAREVRFASAFSFKYSPRPGTPSAEQEEIFIPETVKDERLAQLQAQLAQDQMNFNAPFLGKEIPILIERVNEEKRGSGRAPTGQLVYIDECTHAAGDIVPVRIERTTRTHLGGRVVSQNVLEMHAA